MNRLVPLLSVLALTACASPTPPAPPIPSAPAPIAPVISDITATPRDPRLDSIAAELDLRRQEERELARFYFRSGRRLHDELRYKDALADLSKARRLDPRDPEIADLHELLLVLTGEGRGHRAVIDRLRDERLVLIEQERLELARLDEEGRTLLRAGRHDAAIDRFERILEKLRWFPYELDPGDLVKRTEQAVRETRALAASAKARDRERRQTAALEQARALSR